MNEAPQVPLDILYSFTNKASSVLDTQALMTHFFNILAKELDFDSGGYIIRYEHLTEARTYSKLSAGSDEAKSTLLGAGKRIAGIDEAVRVEGSALRGTTRGGDNGPRDPETSALEAPLRLWGESAGCVVLISSRGFGPYERRVLEVMAEHAERVLERLLASISAGEKKLANVLMSMAEGVYIIDTDGRFSAVNPKGLELLGGFCSHCEESIRKGRPLGEGDSTGCRFTAILEKARILGKNTVPEPFTEEIKNDQGRVLSLSVCPLSDGAGPERSLIITAKDVTEERLIQKRILMSSKLASLGEMAAGIAHEINNPLQSILLNIEILEADADKKSGRRLERVKNSILRLKNIVRDLLIFAREQTTDTEQVDVNILIEKSVDIMRHQLKMANIALELDLASRPLIAECNKNLFQQVIINLLQNSRDAIEGASVGSKVCIKSMLLPERKVLVEVSDDGPGIPDEVSESIFDPFLTTKEVGKGTGLGLSVSRKIIESMGGKIKLASHSIGNTAFNIHIPHHGKLMEERRKTRLRAPDYSILKEKNVLMVDDEAEVLSTVREAIERHVTGVEGVQSGTEALDMVCSNDYDFLFLDIKMPGMNGMELYHKVTEMKPRMAERIIFLSGDIESEKTAEFIRRTRCRYLPKPFGVDDLLGAMYEIATKEGSRGRSRSKAGSKAGTKTGTTGV